MEIFIATFISLFIWGKVSKDALEDKPKRDCIKTLLYCFLSAIIAIIYYMSSQVETSRNYVEIKKLVTQTNTKGDCSDSVYVTINHRMKPDNLQFYADHENVNPLGGVEMLFKSEDSYKNIKINRKALKDIYRYLNLCLYDKKLNDEIPDTNTLKNILKRYSDELNILRPEIKKIGNKLFEPNSVFLKSEIDQLTDLLEYVFQDQRSLYLVTHIPPKRKTFLPIDIRGEEEIHYIEGKPNKHKFVIEDKVFKELFVDPYWVSRGLTLDEIKDELESRNLTLYQYFLGISNLPRKGNPIYESDSVHFLKFTNSDSLFNYVDYFTASDMSQRIFNVAFNSEVPLKCLVVTFDEPINVSEIYPKPDTLDMNRIIYTDRKKLDFLRYTSLTFHAKLPTYENKQLLRSLILTTILTAVFSLFCTNLFLWGKYLVNKFSNKYFIARIITEEEKKKYKKRINLFQVTCFAIAFIIASIPFILYYYAFTNKTLAIYSDSIISLVIKIALIIIAIIVGIAIWRKYLIPKGNKEKSAKSD